MTKSTKKGSSTATRSMRISKRVVNTKRHTTGYIIDGKFHSVVAATKLARRSRLSGVRVVGDHIQAVTGRRRLQDLPKEVRGSK